jgi:hypothetical protein
MRASSLPVGVVGALCALAPGLSLGQPPSDVRSEIDAFAAALDAAVKRVSRSSPVMLAGREGARGYRVPGFGALFVLPPRALPSASPRALAERAAVRSLDDAIRHLEQGLRTASSAAVRAQMEKNLRELRQTRAELTSRDRSSGVVLLSPPAVSAVMAGEEPVELRLEELQRELETQMAEQMRALQEAERSHADRGQETASRMEGQVRELQTRMEETRREVERARREAERQLEMHLPVGPAPPAPPEAPAAPAAPAEPAAAPEMLPPALAPAPWQMWFATEDPADGRTAEAIVRDVRAAVTALLERPGAALHQLRPDEYVAVAVDFVPRVAMAGRAAQKTLVIKARKRDLDDHRAGRLGADELHRRIEYAEY